MGGSYEAINQASDVVNLSETMTQGVWNMLRNPTTYAQPFQTFLSQIEPRLTSLVTDDRFSQAQYDVAQQRANEIRKALGQEWEGSIFSGAAQGAIGRGVATPYMEAIANISQQQNQLRGALLGQGMAGIAGLYGQGLGGLTQLGMPQYWQPDYAYKPGALDWITGLGGTAASLIGAFTGIPGLGQLGQGIAGAAQTGGEIIPGGVSSIPQTPLFPGMGYVQPMAPTMDYWTFNR